MTYWGPLLNDALSFYAKSNIWGGLWYSSAFSFASPSFSSSPQRSFKLEFYGLAVFPFPMQTFNFSIIFMYQVHTKSFQTFFVWAFKIVVDSWTFTVLLLYILWDDWPILRISDSNEQLQQQLEYTLLKWHFSQDNTIYPPLSSGRIWHKINF